MWIFNIFKKKEVKEDPMKYLIVGLGNPGAEYDDTRHNVGFEVLDRLAIRQGEKWEDVRYGWICKFKHKGRTFILLKPNTYMNLSGKAIQYWLQKEKIKQDKLLVVLDDLNLDLGRMKLRAKGSDGGHNGLKNIQQVLGNQQYARLRMGIGDDFKKGKQVNFVLGKWTDKEWELLPDFFSKGQECILSFATIGINQTMSEYNRQ